MSLLWKNAHNQGQVNTASKLTFCIYNPDSELDGQTYLKPPTAYVLFIHFFHTNSLK